MEDEESEIFWEISENLGEISQKIPRNFRKTDRIYWNLLKFSEIYWNFEITENSVKLNFTEIYWNFQIPSKLFPLTEITEIEITNLAG